MKILVACEESQAVTIEFRKKGHEAFSCDLQDCSGGHPEWHIKDDVFNVIGGGGYDMLIGFPPCTFLSSVQTFLCRKSIDRTKKRIEGAKFFMDLFSSDIPLICLENPTGVMTHIFREADQIIHPYMFGDPVMKRTGLWLKGLPTLKHNKEQDLFSEKTFVDVPPPEKIWIQKSTGKVKFQRQANRPFLDSVTRSKLSPAIAKAMADQWG